MTFDRAEWVAEFVGISMEKWSGSIKGNNFRHGSGAGYREHGTPDNASVRLSRGDWVPRTVEWAAANLSISEIANSQLMLI